MGVPAFDAGRRARGPMAVPRCPVPVHRSCLRFRSGNLAVPARRAGSRWQSQHPTSYLRGRCCARADRAAFAMARSAAMIDGFVVLAPLAMLPIVVLFAFVGCHVTEISGDYQITNTIVIG